MTVDFLIPAKLRNNSKDLTRAKIMIYILSFITLTATLLYVFNTISDSKSLFPFLSMGTFSLFLIGLLNITGSTKLVGHIIVGALAVVFFDMTLKAGGIRSLDCICLFIIPLVACITVGLKEGIPWIGACLLWTFYLYGLAGDTAQMQIFKDQTLTYDRNYYLAGTIFNLFFPFGIFSIFYLQNKKLIRKLNKKQLALEQKNEEYEEQALVLKATQKKLEHSNKELEVYAYTTSHDLKQPVNTVKNFTGLLNRHFTKNQLLDERSSEYLNIISSSANNMSRLIEDLLAYAKVNDTTDNQFEKLNLNDILDNVLMDLRHQIDSNQVKIERQVLPTLNVIPTKINQIFQNIISNAIKFKKQDEALILKISSFKTDKHWQLTIEDNGIGIDEKFQEKIFKPFQKGHNKGDYHGSGIGLSTCKRIVKLHKGDIWVESQINIGTKFHFTLNTEEVLSNLQTDTELAPQRREG